MFFPSDYAIIKSQEQRLSDYAREVKNDRLIAEARGNRPGALRRFARAVARGIGQLLVNIGKSLERSDPGELVLTRQGAPR